MKHGPNALIDEALPVVVLATSDADSPESMLRYEKTLSNIQEVTARSGRVIAVATEGNKQIRELVEHVIFVPQRPNCWRRCLKWFHCSCWHTTSPCAGDVTWINRATWPSP